MDVVYGQDQICNVEAHLELIEEPQPLQMEPQVAAQHEIQHHEQVLVVVECIAKIDYEWILN